MSQIQTAADIWQHQAIEETTNTLLMRALMAANATAGAVWLLEEIGNGSLVRAAVEPAMQASNDITTDHSSDTCSTDSAVGHVARTGVLLNSWSQTLAVKYTAPPKKTNPNAGKLRATPANIVKNRRTLLVPIACLHSKPLGVLEVIAVCCVCAVLRSPQVQGGADFDFQPEEEELLSGIATLAAPGLLHAQQFEQWRCRFNRLMAVQTATQTATQTGAVYERLVEL